MKPSSSNAFYLDGLRNSFGNFYLACNSSYEAVDFQQNLIAPCLEAIDSGKIHRLCIFLPPRSGKSDMVTVHFVPWYLGHHPTNSVLTMSYSSDLATTFGRRVRNIMESDLYKRIFPKALISRDSRAKDQFATQAGGNYYAVGFEGTMTGRGADLIIIDDPVKNAQSAQSEAEEAFRRETYTSAVRTRLQPGGAIILCMTRWLGDALSGWILEQEGHSELGSVGIEALKA